MSRLDLFRACLEELQKACELASRLGLSAILSSFALDKGWYSLSMGDLDQAEMEFQKGRDSLDENPKITDIVHYRTEETKWKIAQIDD